MAWLKRNEKFTKISETYLHTPADIYCRMPSHTTRLRICKQKKKLRVVVEGWRKKKLGTFTWCNAVNPSTLAVSMSTPFSMSRSMSSLSPDRQAARNTQPDENFTFRVLGSFGKFDARFVSESSHRFSCSARFDTAELLRASNAILNFTFLFFSLFFLFFSFLSLFFSAPCLRICHTHTNSFPNVCHFSLRHQFLFVVLFLALLTITIKIRKKKTKLKCKTWRGKKMLLEFGISGKWFTIIFARTRVCVCVWMGAFAQQSRWPIRNK